MAIKPQQPEAPASQALPPAVPVNRPSLTSLPTTIVMTPEDAYLAGRMAAQPQTLEEIRKVEVFADGTKNRLALPRYFEAFSYDCSQGIGCQVHPWKQAESIGEIPGKWSYGNKGEFIFRWVKRHKRAIDEAMNAKGWVTVNRRQFPDAPDHLFTANGGIEEGDMVLFILPAKQALALRAAPGKRSTDAVRSRVTKLSNGDAVMTGNLDNDKFYTPQGGGEDEDEPSGPNVTEGRDF